MSGLTPAMRRFLSGPRFGVLATVGLTGAPRQSVMWFELDGDEVLFNTAIGRHKPEHLKREPRVSLLVEDGYRYVCVSGAVRAITDQPTAQADIRRLALRYEGEDASPAMLRRFERQKRISYRFRIEGVTQDGFAEP